jgi:CHAT domain-containing protein
LLCALPFVLALALSLCLTHLPTPATAQSPDQLQQAEQYYDRGQLAEALKGLQQVVGDPSSSLAKQTAALTNLGRVQFELGQFQPALEALRQAEQGYRQMNDRPAEIRSRIQQAEILKARGDNIRAIDLLKSLRHTLAIQSDALKLERSQVLRLLAEALIATGKTLEENRELLTPTQLLQQSQTIAKNLPQEEISAIELALGEDALVSINQSIFADIDHGATVEQRLDAALNLVPTKIEIALQHYKRASDTAPTSLVSVQAQLRQLNLLVKTIQTFSQLRTESTSIGARNKLSQLDTEMVQLWSKVLGLIFQIKEQFNSLPSNVTAITARINFATLLTQLPSASIPKTAPMRPTPPFMEIAHQVLMDAAKWAKNLPNKQIEAQALGALGKLDTQDQQWDKAKERTKKALLLAQQTKAPNTPDLWGQLAEIQLRTGDLAAAKTSSKAAIAGLNAQRKDRVANNPDVQFDYLEQVEPIYRNYVQLLLSEEKPSQDDLKEAITTIDGLQLAELDDFFREACLTDRPITLEKVVKNRPETALIFPIIISEQKLGVIVKSPDPDQKDLHYHLATLPPDRTITSVVTEFRDQLGLAATSNEEKTVDLASDLYQWLIEPFEVEGQLDSKHLKTKTLVFVADGILRSVPMAALYDKASKQYLVQKYAIAVSLASQLLTSPSKQSLSILAAGLVNLPETMYNLDALPGVATEMKFIQETGLLTKPILLEENFTSQNLASEIETSPFNIILHLATHGKFSSRKENTLILMADGFINVDQLSAILRSREQNRQPVIELLVLSACETAEGDSRAALGLSGMAIKSGIRSTIGSLWEVRDDSTSLLIAQFYKALKPSGSTQGMTKAQALREAQIALMKAKSKAYAEPFYWAPFVLVGDWQ